MFQSVRQDGQIYVFHPCDKPYAEICTVVAPPVVKPKYSIPQSFGQQEMVVTLTVSTKNGTSTFKDLPATFEIADVYIGSECVTVSTSRDAFNSRILSLRKKSEDIVGSIDKHKELICVYDAILKEYNPEFAEKQAQNDKINLLEERLSAMSKSMDELKETNRLLVERLSNNN